MLYQLSYLAAAGVSLAPPLALAHERAPVSTQAAGGRRAAPKRVALIGAPLDLGAGRRGVDMGPSAIRYAGLAEHLAEKLGVVTDDVGNVEAPVAESTSIGDDHARYLSEILDVCERVARLVAAADREHELPLVVGGDHSIALGTLAGMARVYGPGGVIWIDAHGDLNTPQTSPTGNVHGMVLAAALGLAGPAFAREGWTLPAIQPASWRSSACARSTRASATCCGSSTRGCSR